jgi:capsular polysaccharide biosynthesis protein
MQLIGAADLPTAESAKTAFDSNGFVYLQRQARILIRKGASGLNDPDAVGTLAALGLTADSEVVLPPTGCAFLSDVSLVGTRTAVWGTNFTTDIYFPNQAERDAHLRTVTSVTPNHWQNEDTGLQMRNGECILASAAPKEAINLPEPVVFVGSHEFSTWGSFLFRNLPKLLTSWKLAPDVFKVLTWAGHQNWLDLLTIAGCSKDQVIPLRRDAIYKAKRVVIPTIQSPHIFLAPEVVAFYQQIADRMTSMPQHRDIYVSRMSQAATGRRVCLNEGEMRDAMLRIGFEIVDPSTTPVFEQIRTFAEARTIVGPSGSGMFNCVFSRPGTKVFDIESEPTWIRAHANLFASLDLEYRFIQGKPAVDDNRPVHRNWTVNVESTLQYIQEYSGRSV